MKLFLTLLLIVAVCSVEARRSDRKGRKKRGHHGKKYAKLSCPEGVTLSQCYLNPCQYATCPGYEGAKCIPNYCGECAAKFYLHGELVECKKPSVERPQQCPNGVRVHKCAINPCRFARCAKHPEARCKPDYCGGCNSKFFMDGEHVNCDSDGEGDKKHVVIKNECPSGLPLVKCFAHPCLQATCDAHPGARCRANYCGGCNAEFYIRGEKVNCKKPSVDRPQCPNGVTVHRCAMNPCRFARCAKHPEARCKPDYCGGCNSKFYIGDEQVNCDSDTEEDKKHIVHPKKPHCNRSLFKCFVDPCEGKKCKNHPEARCYPNYCGGCKADFYFGDEKVQCEGDETALVPFIPNARMCPNGKEVTTCMFNPCLTSKCRPRFFTRCIPDYCGGCKAKFLVGHRRVSCDKWRSGR